MSLSKSTEMGKGKEEGVSHDSTRHSHGNDKEHFGPIMMQGQSSKPIECPTKDTTDSKMHKFEVGQSSKTSRLVNFPFFARFASIPNANKVKLTPDPLPSRQFEAICMKDGKNDKVMDQLLDKAIASGEKAHEPAMAKSSACSAVRFGIASDDSTSKLKRKSPKTRDSESYNNEIEEESIDSKRANHERRRRGRINKKMRTLQELIPNCNKVDEELMLDDAIEYTKALQLQLQAVSMSAGMFMSPMMLQARMQDMYRASMSQFLPAGIGMGMGYGMGMIGLNYSASQMPYTQVPYYPFSQVPSPFASHGALGPNHPGLLHPTQLGLPISTPCAPLPPGVVVPPLPVPSTTSREAVENIGSRATPNDQPNRRRRDPD